MRKVEEEAVNFFPGSSLLEDGVHFEVCDDVPLQTM